MPYALNEHLQSFAPLPPEGPAILLTFDVEDWFQVENFKKYIPFSSWQSYELRVEKNIHRILDLLDSMKLNNSKNQSNQSNSSNSSNSSNTSNPKNPNYIATPKGLSLCAMPHAPRETLKATFFILGWIAERLPHLVQEIWRRGHEVASHGYNHKLCQEETFQELKNDLASSKKLLEDITGAPIYGYRAPNFSIDQETLSLIEEAGYLYDSSYNSYRLNKRYGKLDLCNHHNGRPYKISERFYEFPVSNLKIGRQIFHWSGGGYFRLIPPSIYIQGVKRILKEQAIYLFYTHSWEIDPVQPKLNGISPLTKFRHYLNLDKTFDRLQILLNSLKDYSFYTCIEYLQTLNPTQPTKQAQ